MLYNEIHHDLFAVDFQKYTPAHCISSDCKMGAGIAVPMRKKFGLGGLYDAYSPEQRQHPTCIYYKGVLNLITKERYFHKPTLQTLESSLMRMAALIELYDITAVAMPKIGSGLDRLPWPLVREKIQTILSMFNNLEVLICIK